MPNPKQTEHSKPLNHDPSFILYKKDNEEFTSKQINTQNNKIIIPDFSMTLEDITKIDKSSSMV